MAVDRLLALIEKAKKADDWNSVYPHGTPTSPAPRSLAEAEGIVRPGIGTKTLREMLEAFRDVPIISGKAAHGVRALPENPVRALRALVEITRDLVEDVGGPADSDWAEQVALGAWWDAALTQNEVSGESTLEAVRTNKRATWLSLLEALRRTIPLLEEEALPADALPERDFMPRVINHLNGVLYSELDIDSAVANAASPRLAALACQRAADNADPNSSLAFDTKINLLLVKAFSETADALVATAEGDESTPDLVSIALTLVEHGARLVAEREQFLEPELPIDVEHEVREAVNDWMLEVRLILSQEASDED